MPPCDDVVQSRVSGCFRRFVLICRGWDFPLVALAQTRLLWDPSAIVDMLLLDVQKNSYLRNGHNYQAGNLPAYLPGNGGLLLAVAMMAAGSDSSPPLYFPPSWKAQAEGFPIRYP